jgi:hypothetical protein
LALRLVSPEALIDPFYFNYAFLDSPRVWRSNIVLGLGEWVEGIEKDSSCARDHQECIGEVHIQVSR